MPIMKHNGFSLIEMAIVLVIIGALIGAAIYPLTAQRDSSKIKEANNQLKIIEEAILGFAITNGRLPCPASNANSGFEDATLTANNGRDCNQPRGFIPAADLGLSSKVSCDGYLLDPWNNPYRYSVIAVQSQTAAEGMDYFHNTQMRTIGINQLSINATNFGMSVCGEAPCGAGTVLVNNAVAVYYSLGKHWTTSRGADERQNARTNYSKAAGCPAGNYRISSNNRYVNHESIESGNNQFDDIVRWLSPNIIFSKMLAAQQLP